MINSIKILIFLSGLLFSLNSNAKNLAIIIGNEAYQNVGKLDNPVRDAKLVASKFEAIGYETRLSKNLDEFNFNKLLKSIARESSNYDVTVIYYAGHAVQLGGLNYMLAVDQLPPKTEEDIKKLLGQLPTENKTKITNQKKTKIESIILEKINAK